MNITHAAGKVRATGVVRQNQGGRDLVTAVPIYGVDALGKQQFLTYVFADEAADRLHPDRPGRNQTACARPGELCAAALATVPWLISAAYSRHFQSAYLLRNPVFRHSEEQRELRSLITMR